MPTLKKFREMSGLPRSVRRWSQAADMVKAGQQALTDQALVSKRSLSNEGLSISVDWRAVSRNAPSKSMPRAVPWVHGLIREFKGPSPRIELAPKKKKGKRYPVHLIIAHPDQEAAEKMDWDDTFTLTVDEYQVSMKKAMGPAYDWCPGKELWALVAELDIDYPLVIHAAGMAQGPQDAMDKAIEKFDLDALDWSNKNFPHPDFMNEMRSVFRDKWNFRLDYWPGDPLPDFNEVCQEARDRLQK